jgi:cholesterol oxidase
MAVASVFGEEIKRLRILILVGKDQIEPCNFCGACMIMLHNAKNTLDKTPYLAQQLGAEILAENEVIDVKPLRNTSDDPEGYEVPLQ